MIKREELTRKVNDSIEIANTQWRHLHRLNTWLLIVSLTASAIATLLAGWTSVANDPVIGQGFPGWRLTCGVAAVFTFSSSVCAGINQLLGIAKRAAAALSCVGRLKAISLLIINDKHSVDGILEDYAKITADHPDLTR